MLNLLCYIYPLLICGYDPPEVTIGWSRVMGIKQQVNGNMVNVFLGIPYAEPPLNGYRFRPPESIKSVNYFGYYAGKFKPRCISKDYYDKFLGSVYDDQQEDCLYLNIWSPVNLSAKKANEPDGSGNDDDDYDGEDKRDLKPVLVYLHDPLVDVRTIDGKTLSLLGDMVVVTFDYRTGLFGLIEGYDNQISDNAIFHDTKSVLKWIQENIQQFGGDANRVTLFADGWESLRAGLQFSYLINEKLFNRMIIRNGPTFTTSDTNPTIHWQDVLEVAEKVGCDQQKNQLLLLYCLRNSDAKDLINGYLSINTSSHTLDNLHPWVNSPEIITKTFTLDGFISENWPRMPPVLMIQMISEEDVRKMILDRNHMETIDKLLENLDLAELKRKSCFGETLQGKELLRWTARQLLECSFLNLGREMTQTGVVYSLLIEHGPNKFGDDTFLFKKTGSSYLDIIFGLPILKDKYYSDEAMRLSKEVVKILSRFVGSGKVKWPQLVEVKESGKLSYHQYWMNSEVCPELSDMNLKMKLCQLPSNRL